MIRCTRVEGHLWGIGTPSFSPAVRDACKATPGMRWDADRRLWVGYSDAVATAAGQLLAKKLYVDTKTIPPPQPTGIIARNVAEKGLREYQKIGVEFLISNAPSGALLADAMGCGKTAQGIRAARALKCKTLIVCPNIARLVWEKELAKWWPDCGTVLLPKGTKPYIDDIDAANPNVVVIHYDIVHAWAGPLLAWGFKFIIFDEAQYLKSERSRRSTACRELAATAKYRAALSGTPMTDRPRDLWNVVETISPGRFGNFFSYALRHCDAHKEEVVKNEKIVWIFDGKSNLDELSRRLQHFMLRRTLQDVRLEIPPKQRQVIDIEIPAKMRIAPDPEIIKSPKLLRQALAYAADGKLPQIIEGIRDSIAEGHSVLAFTHRKEIAEKVVNAIAIEGYSCAFIHGGVDLKKRQAIIDSKPQLLAATIDSMSVAIDVTYVDVVDFVELTWEPIKLLQAEARAHRWGQQKPVLVRYHIAEGTIDDLIATVVIGKLDVFEQTIGTTNENLGDDLKGGDTAEDVLRQMTESLAKAAKARAANERIL
jgi:SWI/SNF-related matrix-associated actin-dependent regulator of chromatin subfamily A-like protein 1